MRRRIPHHVCRLMLAALWPLVLTGVADAQGKTDVVVMTNGDTVTCEIKELVRGRLRVSTDSMGTVQIEWDDVRQVTSLSRFEVELDSGERFVGSFQATSQPDRLAVTGDNDTTVHDHLTDLPPSAVPLVKRERSSYLALLRASS